MAGYLQLARVHSIDSVDEDVAWLEFPNGVLAVVDADELPSRDVGTLLEVSNDLNTIFPAPFGVTWPRQLRTIGTLVSFAPERALIRIGDQVRAIDRESIQSPNLGDAYFFEEKTQLWSPLSAAEAQIVEGLTAEDSMPFTVEEMKPADGGAAAVGGSSDKVAELTRLVNASFDSRDPDSPRAAGPKPVSGAIFFGPPGTGKTHLARSVAQETSAQLITVNGPELVSKWVGATERVLRELFAHADKYERSIIFFDEFDTVGARRSPESHDFANRQVGQLLATMDGATRSKRPFVIAATNRLEDVDPAFLRPGRFDYPVEFRIPNSVERLEILSAQARLLSKVDSTALLWLAANSSGWTPAELGLIWTEAETRRVAENLQDVNQEHVLFGFDRARKQHALIARVEDTWAIEKQESQGAR